MPSLSSSAASSHHCRCLESAEGSALLTPLNAPRRPRALGTVRGSAAPWASIWTVCPAACSRYACCAASHGTALAASRDCGAGAGPGSAGPPALRDAGRRPPGALSPGWAGLVGPRQSHSRAWHHDRDGWTAGLSWDCPLGFSPVASPEELDFSRDSPGPPEPGGSVLEAEAASVFGLDQKPAAWRRSPVPSVLIVAKHSECRWFQW